jgi:hypothetical protein
METKIEETNEVNLVEFDTYAKRYYATVFIFQYGNKLFEHTAEYSYGAFGLGVFIKLIRQYFAKRTPESNTVFFEGVPVSSLKYLQNISIAFNFTFKNEKLSFHYVIQNTDTHELIAEDARDDIEVYDMIMSSTQSVTCNRCDDTDYVFTEHDFDDDYDYDEMRMMKCAF